MTGTITDLIDSEIENFLSEIHTSFPAQVLKYDSTKQSVDVQPCIQKKLTDDSVLPLPIIHNVPIIFPSSGGALLSFPVEAGDTVLVQCCERSIDLWLSSDGGQIDPEDTRKFNLSDAIAIPGLYPFSKNLKPAENELCLKYKDGKFSINSDSTLNLITKSRLNIQCEDDVVINSAKSIKIISDKTLEIHCDSAEITANTTKFNGNIECKNINCTQLTATSEVIAGGISLSKHIHAVPAGTDKAGGKTLTPT